MAGKEGTPGASDDTGEKDTGANSRADTNGDTGTKEDVVANDDAGSHSVFCANGNAGAKKDAGGSGDAGSGSDAGASCNAGTKKDAGRSGNAGAYSGAGPKDKDNVNKDTGFSVNAATDSDAGVKQDTGVNCDAGTKGDAGANSRAGAYSEAGAKVDVSVSAAVKKDAVANGDACGADTNGIVGAKQDDSVKEDAGVSGDAIEAGASCDTGDKGDADSGSDAGIEEDVGANVKPGTKVAGANLFGKMPPHIDPKVWEEYKKVRRIYDDYKGFEQVEIEEVFKRMETKVKLKKLFKLEEYAELCLYQKKRIRNIAKNLTLQMYIGLPLPSENELRAKIGLPPVGGFKAPKVQSDSETSDEEWKPNNCKTKLKKPQTMIGLTTLKNRQKWLEKKCMVKNKKYDPTAGKLEDLEVKKEFRIESLLGQHYRSKSADGFKFKKKKTPVTAEDVLRYPKRDIPKTIYTEPVVPEEDHFIYCDDCDKLYLGECSEHPLTREPDTVIKIGLVNRARRTCPDGISIAQSKIRKSGFGAWTDKAFSKNTVFGPYEGENVHKQDVHKLRTLFEGGYAWEIYKKEKLSHYIDGQDMKKSNWLRYINCARNEEEQNLIAYQYQGKIYYKLYKDVKKGHELLVWYGDQYAEQLGIPLEYKAKIKEIKAKIEEKNAVKVEKTNPLPVLYNLKPPKNLATEFHECSKCEKVFSSVEALAKHTKNKHPDRSKIKKHKCPLCSYSTDIVSNFKHHERTHSGKKPFKCETCSKRFSQKSYLKTHIRIHTKTRPFKCELCGKSFTQFGDLNKHISAIHDKIKSFVCKICGNSFGQAWYLKNHIRTHTGEKPYSCELCSYRCSDRSNLRTHIITNHTHRYPHCCHLCDKGFIFPSQLKTHIKNNH